MKKTLILVSIVVFVFACGFGGSAPSQSGGKSASSGTLIIDDFEDGNYTTNPEWWKFDNVSPNVVDNADYQKGDPTSLGKIGNYSLNITGSASEWYAGGLGTYIARQGVDYSGYNALVLDVYGNGAGSGTIKIELNDDDNGTWDIETDPNSNFENLYDDKFSYSLIVD